MKVGINGAVRDISDLKVGVSGAIRSVSEAYVGVNGAVKKVWPLYKVVVAEDIPYKNLSEASDSIFVIPNPFWGWRTQQAGVFTFTYLKNGPVYVYYTNSTANAYTLSNGKIVLNGASLLTFNTDEQVDNTRNGITIISSFSSSLSAYIGFSSTPVNSFDDVYRVYINRSGGTEVSILFGPDPNNLSKSQVRYYMDSWDGNLNATHYSVQKG